jgi:hypothetical protein
MKELFTNAVNLVKAVGEYMFEENGKWEKYPK